MTEFSCNLWTTWQRTPDHSFLVQTENTAYQCPQNEGWPFAPPYYISGHQSFLSPWALLQPWKNSIRLNKNCKVLKLPDLCQCLLSSQGIIQATLVSVLKNYIWLESKKLSKKTFQNLSTSYYLFPCCCSSVPLLQPLEISRDVSDRSIFIRKTQVNSTKCKAPMKRN